MIYRDYHKNAYDRKFVLVVDMSGELLCQGVYDTYAEAVGAMMCSIWDFSDSYQKEGSVFDIGLIESTDNGDMLTVTFKAPCWTNEEHEKWHILYHDAPLDKGKHEMTAKERQIWYWMKEIEKMTAEKSTYPEGSLEKTKLEERIKSARITLEQIRSEQE